MPEKIDPLTVQLCKQLLVVLDEDIEDVSEEAFQQFTNMHNIYLGSPKRLDVVSQLDDSHDEHLMLLLTIFEKIQVKITFALL